MASDLPNDPRVREIWDVESAGPHTRLSLLGRDQDPSVMGCGEECMDLLGKYNAPRPREEVARSWGLDTALAPTTGAPNTQPMPSLTTRVRSRPLGVRCNDRTYGKARQQCRQPPNHPRLLTWSSWSDSVLVADPGQPTPAHGRSRNPLLHATMNWAHTADTRIGGTTGVLAPTEFFLADEAPVVPIGDDPGRLRGLGNRSRVTSNDPDNPEQSVLPRTRSVVSGVQPVVVSSGHRPRRSRGRCVRRLLVAQPESLLLNSF